MRRILMLGLAILGCGSLATAQTPLPAPSPAQSPSPTPVVRTAPASKDELAAIAARGKLLAEYDQAAWHASDAALPLLQSQLGAVLESKISSFFYVADKVKNNWVVSFGRLTDAQDEFLVFVEAVQKGKDFRAAKLDTPRSETGRLLTMARAVSKCRTEFKGENRPYNIAILPASKNGWHVYVLPAQTDANVFPVGGDVRYTVSDDGKTILETHQMHVSILEFQGGSNTKGTPAAMVRTAFLDDAPEDSDVFFALTFQPSTMHLVISRNFVYSLTSDGKVQYLARTEDFVKK